MNADDAPRWPLHVVVWLLLPLAIVGAGVLSASATLALAARYHVPADVSPFLIAMVEVVSLAATLLAIFSVEARLRRQAMALIIAATAVAMIAGWQRYDWVGLLAGVFMVFLLHLASKAWLELRERQAPPAASEPATEIIEAQLTEQVAAERVEPHSAETEVFAKVEPEPEPPATIPSALDDLDALTVYRAQALLAENPKMGRPRLKAELGITDHTAKRLLAALRPVRPVEESA